MAKTKSNRPGEQKTKTKKKAKRTHIMLPRRPNRARNAFLAFLKQFWASLRAQNRNRQAMRVAAERWHTMDQEEKDYYQSLVAPDQNRYNQEITTWKRQKAFFKRPATMYALLTKDIWQREKNNNLSISQIGKMASKEWKSLSDKQKEPYRQRFERSKRNYELSLQDFAEGLPVNLDRKLDTEQDYVPLLLQELKDEEDEWSEEEWEEEE